MKKTEQIIKKLSDGIGFVIAIILLLMMLNVAFDTLSRYLFKVNYIAMQEMEWHLFSVITLLGISYALLEDAHVSVDIISAKFPNRVKYIINMIGVFLFILPISLLIIVGSYDFVNDSFQQMEKSGDPGGLKYRFIIKSLIPISFVVLIIASIGFFAKNYNALKQLKSIKLTGDKSL